MHIINYNATNQNNCEIDTVHNHKLYIATVGIEHKAVDCIHIDLSLFPLTLCCLQEVVSMAYQSTTLTYIIILNFLTSISSLNVHIEIVRQLVESCFPLTC